MKWILITFGIWADGAHTITAQGPTVSGKELCELKEPTVYRSAGQPDLYLHYVCIPEDVWNNFAKKGLTNALPR